MPNDSMNDSSFIDEGTFADKDFTWAFSAMWNKKSSDRCRANIADTIMVNGGEPGQWFFTAKVRMHDLFSQLGVPGGLAARHAEPERVEEVRPLRSFFRRHRRRRSSCLC